MNQAGYKGAGIIVAGRNFACGSSREQAVTVMFDNGFRAFIAPSFGDIFAQQLLPERLRAGRAAGGARQ